MHRLLTLGLVLVSLLGATVSRAQSFPVTEEGRNHLSRSWSWRDYRANSQNWGVVQASHGSVFVANSDAVLEFDGEEWRRYAMPDGERTTVRSLAVDGRGRVYVGGVGDFGALRPDSIGFLRFVSFRQHVAEADREFTDVWTVHTTDRGVVFQTAERLFRWDGREMESWETESRFRTAFSVYGDIYVWEEGVGLKVLGDDAVVPILGGAAFAERKVDALLPHAEGLLAVVRDEGLILLKGGRERRLDTDGSAYLRDFRPYTAISVPGPRPGGDDVYAVSTFGGGVAIIDMDGRLVRVYREDVGLTSADLNVGLHLDGQGGLWVARLNGLTRIDLFARLTMFDELMGLEGSVYTLAEHEGHLYAGTSNGLYRLEVGTMGRPEAVRPYAGFEAVEGVANAQTWATLSTSHGLLVGTLGGIWAVEQRRAYLVTPSEAFSLLAPSQGEGTVMFGAKTGIGRLVYRGTRWTVAEEVGGVDGEIRYLEEDADGSVWASELNGALYRLSGVSASVPDVQRFDAGTGLTVSAGPLVRWEEDLWIAPREGVYDIGERTGRLELKPVSGLRSLAGIYGIHGTEDALWISEGGAFYPADRSVATGLELRDVNILDLLVTEAGVMWVGTSDGLLRYDPRVQAPPRAYAASVRMVTDQERVPLRVGTPVGGDALSIPYARGRQVRLEVAASFFDAPGEIEYQYRLDGFDDDWGAWSEERVASYTNLWPGDYTLHVRARDLHGHVSDASTFAFRIEPPWYLTWWAYGSYALGFVALFWGLSSWRGREHSRKLDVQRARSARFQRLSTRLEKTNVRLRQADKLKDDLLANTSHELRTPLTAILGFSEMLLDDVEGENRSLAEGIHRGGQRLLTTVNGLLDMFKLQSGTMPVEARAVDAAEAIRESVGLLQPLAAARGTDLRVLPETLALPSVLDPDLLDRVVTNLVSNALKFTEAGRVLVLVDGDDRELRISVQDTGIGIPPGDLDRILEPFEQVSTGYERTHEGTGLGLAIVQRVIALVGGDLRFESEVGVGTTVHFTVPRNWSGCAEPVDATEAGLHPGLDGIHVLGVCLDDASARTVHRAVGTQGTTTTMGSLGRALREARTTVYDVVLVAAGEPTAERRHVRALRAVPGYAHVPVIRLGGETLAVDELSDRGFTDALAVPVQVAEVGTVLATSLSRIDALADVLAVA